ncbi:BadF/BadG/BcrA/BcrD ATPase family protein [Pannonibacter tanglangensis]|uniref:N-acetylglucosamine kinase n=1 Tax=Pannonibacter tanglangensis TaxID=2750084 RepID=A0ABW9ZGI7_9HYPH|nr:BadF/BadG/BcrA/BcrD ATPase family protein [Pannonibacter sp. XCT-34]NBN63813.1 N-acetylglucosamine kinase [Pannonibacter sp. XCT-34]
MTTTPQFYLGVDGGGTGCRARITDAAGQTLGEGSAGPATTRIGIAAAWQSIQTAVAGAAAMAGLPASALATMDAGIGLAGLSRRGALEALNALPNPFRSRRFISDAAAACLGAHSGQDGAIVIVGTGSIGVGFLAGRHVRVGGYGFPVSDEGSGADLGLKALQQALRAHDGRIAETPLLAALLDRFNRDPMEIIGWMDRATATDYATLAPEVLSHADQGDDAARALIRQAAGAIDGLARALLACGAERLTLLGGLAAPLEPWVAPEVRCRLKPADGDAVAGALHLARSPATAGG